MMGLKTQKLDLQMADISGSKWNEVNAEGLEIDNVCLAHTKFNNVNMSNLDLNDVNMQGSSIKNANLSGLKVQHANFSHAVIDHVHLYGTEFHNVVLPVEGDGNFDPEGTYKPVRFQDCDLTNTQLQNCNLTNVEINHCDISGLKINGVLIEELIQQKIK
ncbi:pentapeptide repeat-containing protein [Mesobacillus foraminis]|uniref:Pentapeptide repeat protein n=1 Tax=Mesobacillus foraminis TaxID=279826 RepID=A0A4R2BJP3_9BACI|nr:pentapeptide repeat-containing protein [Mesobacillus foraminis]TCN26194.1 pentapeptide repeat protein [Mesobacillus foraminis]